MHAPVSDIAYLGVQIGKIGDRRVHGLLVRRVRVVVREQDQNRPQDARLGQDP